MVVNCNRTRVIMPLQQIPVVDPSIANRQEVFSETPDPVVDYPAINFVGGQFPAYPDVLSMKVFIP